MIRKVRIVDDSISRRNVSSQTYTWISDDFQVALIQYIFGVHRTDLSSTFGLESSPGSRSVHMVSDSSHVFVLKLLCQTYNVRSVVQLGKFSSGPV